MTRIALVFLLGLAIALLLLVLAYPNLLFGGEERGTERRRRWRRRPTALDPVGPPDPLERALRLAATGHALLLSAPELRVDGQPLYPLIAESLPALVRHYEETARHADGETLAAAEAALKAGLDRIEAVLARARATLSAAELDRLRTQVRYLELRHPDEWPRLDGDAPR